MEKDVARAAAGDDRVPRATYRLQFNKDLTLAQAREHVAYLDELGVSHIYASPLLKAMPGSMHGYDTCDFSELNPELGTPDDLAKLHDELASRQMGLVLDVVPNHMGINGKDNHWWWDVLTHGATSRYAGCFDIDWHSPDPRLRGKVALPILGERYHEALLHKAIRLAEGDGSLFLECNGMSLPVSPESVSSFLRRAAEAVPGGESKSISATINEVNNNPKDLDKFIQMQHYLLMYWRNGDAVLNYRRFFTITSLAGIRIEKEWVFEQAFSLVKQWADQGWVNSLRVDHVDGLRHPEQFLQRLREMAPRAWIVVEKILEPGEPLNPQWPVDGTTGYDFLVNLNGVFVDPDGEKPLSDFYVEFTGQTTSFPALVRAKKQMVIQDQLTAETNRLTDLLVQISARHWDGRDFSRAELAAAWTELASCIPVYRTYVRASDDPEISKSDARLIQTAAKTARENRPDLAPALFDFLEELLLIQRRGGLEDDFVLRFQQLTGPIMAKAVEDTALYCYARFAGLNEVGGDPSQFGLSVAAFHLWCKRQQSLWPVSMVATATHDTKWGGDVRARLALLSERPQEWTEAVRRWSKMNEPKRSGQWPDRRTEYLFYQALVGAWPLTKERAQSFMQKAVREAKEYTDWQKPVAKFEEALQNFVGGAMDDSTFMSDVEQFVAPLLDLGWINSLAQTLVKLTATGVPDIYQGSELWDLSLADPDNRRSVDFELRKKYLAEAKKLSPEEVWQKRGAGFPKMWLIAKVLDFRRKHPNIFDRDSAYQPLAVSGKAASHVLAFARGDKAVVVAPRLVGSFKGDWADTNIELPTGRWKNVLTELPIENASVKGLMTGFPVALLSREETI